MMRPLPKENPVKNAKLAKLLVKGVSSLIFSAALGYTYKASKKIDERIDQHFAEPKTNSDQDN